jgi:hypothetical protein
MRERIAWTVVITISLGLATRAGQARADYVTLRTGGEIRGELQIEAKSKVRPEFVTIRTLTGATVVVERADVQAVVRRRFLLEEYESLRRAAPDTLDAQWDLAEWCRQKSLSKEREGHLRRVVALDPEHTLARRALGHVRDKKSGAWTTQDELMSARGYVKYKGRYMLPQELELIQQDARVTETEKAWFKKVRMWHGWLDSERPERQTEALAQLQEIHDPEAVPALSRTFKDVADQDRRRMYVSILSKIGGERPISPLVLQSLWDESRPVREAAIAGLRMRDVTKAIPYYLRALKNSVNLVVNRAADALAQLGSDAVVPQLIDALVTRHVYTELVPEQGLGMTSSGGMVPVGQPILPPNIEALLATGQLPYGVRVEAPMNSGRMKEITYEKDEENESVLIALNIISGENFGYDEPTWRRWYNSHKNAAAAAKRKKAKP